MTQIARPMIKWQRAKVFVTARLEKTGAGISENFMFPLNVNVTVYGRSWKVPLIRVAQLNSCLRWWKGQFVSVAARNLLHIKFSFKTVLTLHHSQISPESNDTEKTSVRETQNDRH
jgi:hypothetical protein